MDTGFEQRIRERAYEIWMAAGQEDGLADLHWLSAEAAVLTEMQDGALMPTRKAKIAKPRVVKTAAKRKTALA